MSVWLGAVALWIGGHLILYVAVLRRLERCRSEGGILASHVVSFALSTLALGAWLVAFSPPHALAIWLGFAAAHGIYSLSFLELWSLTQISYSLAILDRVDRDSGSTRASLAEFADVGAAKQQTRREDLVRIGLLRASPEGPGPDVRPTGLGAVVAAVARALRWLSAARSLN